MYTAHQTPFFPSHGCWLYGVNPLYVQAENLTWDELVTLDGCAYDDGYDCVRMLVSAEDTATAALLETDYAHLAGKTADGSLCFELTLGDCPLLPIPMHPAYRFGEMTPWGGDKLGSLFGKAIPDPRTGEALEISAIPGLESVSPFGETLTELINLESTALTGTDPEKPFPLLLKLLCTREPLSVQVHPDDAYAAAHEDKLGKTEAWVILSAEEGASILYGIREGVTIEDLRRALTAGDDIEPMIRRVFVNPGDVFYMPSGMVHAVSGGIVLYEIQQSSDITYRLWDYNRTNAKGEKRPLHIQQSLDVIDARLQGQRAQMPEGGNAVICLLDVPCFKLNCACVDGELPLNRPGSFVMLTALDALHLCWQGTEMPLSSGESVLLPASCPHVWLKGKGRALLSAPRG
ncbi:MAG: mannose-6-phosphate isomerase [Clostridiales bacterium]|nr:mannose-6-phosphate isomerase [Clostridiales bacterium]